MNDFEESRRLLFDRLWLSTTRVEDNHENPRYIMVSRYPLYLVMPLVKKILIR